MAEGARVILVDIDSTAGAAALAIIDSPAAVFIPCDVSSPMDVGSMMREAETIFGRIDILFNNAGIMHIEDGDSVSTPSSVWDLTMNMNAKGIFHCCKYGNTALRRAGGGSVINTASFVARLGAATPQIACILVKIV